MCVRVLVSEYVCAASDIYVCCGAVAVPNLGGLLFFSNVSEPWSMPRNCFDASRVLSCCCVCVMHRYVCICVSFSVCVCVSFSLSQWARDACFSGATSWFALVACKLSVSSLDCLSVCLSVCAPTQDSFCLTCGKLSACRKAKAAFFCSLSLSLGSSVPSTSPSASSFFSGFFFACHFDALTGKFWMQNPTTFSKNKKKKQKLRQG